MVWLAALGNWLFNTKLGRIVLISVVAAIAVLISWRVAYDRGKDSGFQQGKAAMVDDAKQTVERNNQDFQTKLSAYQSAVDRANAVIETQDRALERLNQTLAAMSVKQQAAKQKVDALPDAEVLADVRGKLGIVQVSDTSALTTSELREIDRRITDYEFQSQGRAALEDKVSSLEQKIDGIEDKVKGIEAQRDTAVHAYNDLMPLYVQAYNASQGKPNWFVRVVTLGLYKGKHIDLPAPISLPTLEAAK